MTKYGLKVNTKYNLKDYEEKVMTTAGDIVLFESGIYKIYCDGDTFVKHNIIDTLMHITCISVRDDIKINIEASGRVANGGACGAAKENALSDIHHKIISRNKNVEISIKVKSVVEKDGKIIYRSSVGGEKGSSGTGNQNAKFIMLSNECEIDAEPSLELESNLIPTVHSISIGGLDKQSIFYMNLHGLDNEESEIELVESFLSN